MGIGQIDWAQIAQGGAGDFLGGLLVTILFFFIDNARRTGDEGKIRQRRLMASKIELQRIEEFARRLKDSPQAQLGSIDTGLLSFLVIDLVKDAEVENFGAFLSKVQASATLLNGLTSILTAEVSGLGQVIRGNEELVRNLETRVSSAATELETRCTEFHGALNRQAILSAQ